MLEDIIPFSFEWWAFNILGVTGAFYFLWRRTEPIRRILDRPHYEMRSDRLLWFVKASYSYINPRGFIGHVNFLMALPGAAFRYMKLRRQS